jgi:release factor glutamine methyltransferase
VDVGTGTGAIALALKHERPDAIVTATDASSEALALARENAEANGLEVELVETDLLEGVDGPFDLVVSNPPYVLEAELDTLQPELAHEPVDALVDRGQTERLIESARFGWLVLEVHEERAYHVADLLRGAGYADVKVTPDLALRPRVVEGRWIR